MTNQARPEVISHAQLAEWDRQHVWHPFTQMAEYESLLIERGEGCRLWDTQGRCYLDGVSSLWCNVHGHRHPKLDAAIRDQLDRIAHTTLLGAGNPTTARLARRLVELAPVGLNHVFFSDSGANALEVALKMAFQYWQQSGPDFTSKQRFLAFDDAYHGDTIGTVSIGGVDLFNRVFKPLLFDAFRLPAPNPQRPPQGVASHQVLGHCLEQLETALKRHHHEIAAIVLEPLVQGAAGMVVHPEGFLRGVRELATRYNVLLIADEVAVGFGRTGRMFACEHEQVTPDFLCLAKGITGGYLPVAATMTTTRIWDAFLGPYSSARQFFHGHTYGGNALGAAVALASLEVFEDEGVLAGLPPKIQALGDELARIDRLPHVGFVRQCGLMAGVELVSDPATATPYPWAEQWGLRVCRVARDRGVLLRPLGHILVIMPPLSIAVEEIRQMGQAVETAIQAVTERGECPSLANAIG